MTKLRVYEYAKQLNMSSKEILTILSRVGEPVANHMSVLDESMVQKVEQFFSDVKQRAAKRHATEVEKEWKEKQRQQRENGADRPASERIAADGPTGHSEQALAAKSGNASVQRTAALASSAEGEASTAPLRAASSPEVRTNSTVRMDAASADNPSAPPTSTAAGGQQTEVAANGASQTERSDKEDTGQM
ncbi:translation initiation factor IF-2 N-terminal domain-containing protein [Alicyclobacillus sp. SP_1]|uniref:translation initiation factor IF-2 N-terminal domain-containing protein n=1 Tax=Alicyclobacillus sp. SP_1 TaxID=2942475 RepID=UPI0035BE151D